MTITERPTRVPLARSRSRPDENVLSSPKASPKASPDSQFIVEGPGKKLAAPKVQTFFRIRSAVEGSSGPRLRAPDVKVAFKGPAAVKSEVVQDKTTVLVRYTAPMSGDYRLTITVGSIILNRGSPAQIRCQAPRPDENLTRLMLGGGIGFVDERFRAHVECFDQFGNKWNSGGDFLVAKVLDNGHELQAADVQDAGDGNFTVSFVPCISAVYQLSIELEGRSLKGSPFDIRVKSDETIPSKCKLLGTGMVHGIAGKANRFSIQACDGKGVPRRIGGDHFQALISAADGASIRGSVHDNLDGTYNVDWTSSQAGEHEIAVTLDGAPVGDGGMGVCNVVPGDLEASECSCHGNGLKTARAGEEAAFFVTAADCYGNLRLLGGDDIAALVYQGGIDANHDGKPARLNDLGDGRYQCSYTANFVGPHDVVVQAGGKPVAGSPFRVTVSAGEVCAENSRVYGPGMSAIGLGRPAKVFVDIQDSLGNKVHCNNAEHEGIKLMVEGPSPCRVLPTTSEDGALAFSYLATAKGTYTISATVNGCHLRGSPATVTASTAEAFPALCEVVGAPLKLAAVAGEESEFQVVAKDANGTQKSIGGDLFTCFWTRVSDEPSEKVSARIDDIGNGEYKCSFKETVACVYRVSVQLKGDNIAGSPFIAEVGSAEVDPTACTAFGDLVASTPLVCNRSASLILRPRDRFHNTLSANPCLGRQGFEVEASGPDGAVQMALTAMDESSGQLTAQLTPARAGLYTVSCRYKGELISGSPWELQATPDSAVAHRSSIQGLPPSLVSGKTERIVVVAKDEHGNVTCGGDHVTMESDDCNGRKALQVSDNRDGTYSADLCPLMAGSVTVRVFVHKKLVELPQTLMVVPGEFHALTRISDSPIACRAGEEFSLPLAAADVNGNRLASKTGLKFTATCSQKGVSVSVRDLNNGTIVVSGKVTSAGDFTLDVNTEAKGTKGSAPVPLITAEGVCSAGANCPAKCIIEPADVVMRAGEEGLVTVSRVDAWGNKLKSSVGEAPLSVKMKSKSSDAMTASLFENGDGSVAVHFRSSVAGKFAAEVLCSKTGERISRSGIKAEVGAVCLSAPGSGASWSVHEGLVDAGSEIAIDLTARDCFGNKLSELDSSNFEVTFSGPEELHMKPTGNPLAVKGVVSKAGSYLVSAMVSGKPLPGWPRQVRVVPAKPHAPKSRLSGQALCGKPVVVGESAEVILHTFDKDGNVVKEGGSKVTAVLSSQDGSRQQHAQVVDHGNGTYQVLVSPECAGTFLLHAKVNGVAVCDEGAQIAAEWGPFMASHCAAVLTSAGEVAQASPRVGEAAKLKVTSMRPLDRLLPCLAVSLHCPSGAVSSLPSSCDADGIVSSWKWAEVGQYSVVVTVGGENIPGSPFVAAVEPGAAHLPYTQVIGESDVCIAGEPTAVRLITHDKQGHRCDRGGQQICVKVDGKPVGADAKVSDLGDGTYKAVFTPTVGGPLSLVASLKGGKGETRLASGLLVSAGRAVAKESSIVWDPNQGKAKAGQTVHMEVVRADAFGNVVRSPEGQPAVNLKVDGPAVAVVQTEETKDGRVLVQVTATMAGKYKATAAFADGKESIGAPVQFEVLPLSPCPEGTKTNLVASQVSPGDEVCVTIDLYDRYGNPIKASTEQGRAIEATVSGPECKKLPATLDGDGKWVLKGTLSTAGAYSILVSLDGADLRSWPRPLHVQADASQTGDCRLVSLAPVFMAGSQVKLLAALYDPHGNAIRSGGGKFSAKAAFSKGKETPETEVVDNLDGTFTVSFHANQPGSWSVVPQLHGKTLEHRKVDVEVGCPPVSAAGMRLGVEGLEHLVCGSNLAVSIHLDDPWQPVDMRMAPLVSMVLPSGLVQHVQVSKSKEDSKRLVGTFKMTEAGEHRLLATLGADMIKDSQVDFAVAPAQLHAAACQVEGMPGASSGIDALSFTIRGFDMYSNPQSVVPSDVAIVCDPPSAVGNIKVAPATDGRAVSIEADVVEKGSMSISVREQNLGRLWDLCPTQIAGPLQVVLSEKHGDRAMVATVKDMLSLQLELRHAASGRLAEFADSEDNLDAKAILKPSGGEEIQGSWVPCKVTSLGHGRFSLAVSPGSCGDLDLHITPASIGSAEGSEGLKLRATVVPSVTKASECRLDGLNPSSPVAMSAGQRTVITVLRHDAYGNRVHRGFGAGEAVVRAAAHGPGPMDCTVSEETPGTVNISCFARVAGSYQLKLFMDDGNAEPVTAKPLTLMVGSGAADHNCSSFRLEGLEQNGCAVQAGEKVTVAVKVRDQFGNPVGVLGEHIRVIAGGPAGKTNFVCPKSAGELADIHCFQAEFSVAGTHSVSVTLAEGGSAAPVHISSDFSVHNSVQVLPAQAVASKTTVFGVPAKMVAGQRHEFSVTPKDLWGNDGAHGASIEAVLEPLEKGEDKTKCLVSKGVGGALIVVAECFKSGQYLLCVNLRREGDGASEEMIAQKRLTIEEATTDATSCAILSYWPERGAVAGIAAGFLIQACDSFGNPRTCGGDKFCVDIRGVDPDGVQVLDRMDGTYCVRYTAPSEGTFAASVTLGSHHIRGSPLALPVFRDVSALAAQEMEGRLAATVNTLRRGVGEAKALHSAARAEMQSLQQFLPVLCDGVTNQVLEAIKGHETLLAESRAALSREAVERKRLHNLVQELRGNIRVYVRIKPLLADEGMDTQQSVLRCLDDRRVQCQAMGSTKSFEFDHVFDGASTQAQVFEDVSQLVTSALDGYNVCIFAYGQTGAGKTHTMEGPKSDPGINYRTMRELFRSICDERPDCSYNITCSMVEIYNEAVHDLLDENDHRREMELQSCKGGFTVPGLTESVVESPEQIFEIMEAGFEHRAVGCHDVNAHSSRSHCLLIVNVNGTNLSTGVTTHGKLTLCDLAGSERVNKTGASGLTLTEAQNINSSLLALGNVISALLQQSSHVPYRNSKLTMLLQDSLGGDAKALMLCNVAQPAVYAQETLSSLVFAAKVSNVVMKTPQRHLEDADSVQVAPVASGPAASREPAPTASSAPATRMRRPTSRAAK